LQKYVLLAPLALAAGAALAQTPSARECEPAPAKAVSVQGSVEAKRVGASDWQPVRLNDTFCPGDQLRVHERSRADVALLNQSVLRLNANSAITVEAPKQQSKGVIDLVRGAVHFFSRGPNSLDVNTPFTVAGVRGTEFYVNVEPQRTLITVFEGTVAAENTSGSLMVRDGQSAQAEAGKAPVLRTVVRPRDAVTWTLYYPPIIHDRQAPGYKAQSLLAVGAVDEAQKAIQSTLQAAPNDADALGLASVIALVQNNKDQALQLAQKAVTANPNSAAALIARSYAEQARFDLQAARASVQRAVEAEPNNALAWARLAELQSAFGERDKALSAAQRAAELDPNLSRTQTVLGFAQLISIDLDKARQSFEKAIALDQADPLPRLGLGLAKIRGGNLDAGARDIEIAASLDPSNSLVRSYLGKAYYEEKRSPLDQRELGMAKQLDPQDPTPWLYDAIAKQTTNQPVAALHDIEKAQELNENRAVYRSKLLLDSDAAARSASQARIFSDLGFQQRALVEGWEAVNRDPTNYSAHRFLSDSYSSLPRHKIARVSELLQSQLLAPVTSTPLQPRLAESNLFLISSGGPTAASFNEFNPLFNSNGANLLVSGLVGELGTSAGEAVVGGIAGKLGYSAGYSRFSSNGFRTNADQDDEIGNVFLQYDFTPETSLQAEYRTRTTTWGDLTQRFFADQFDSNLRNRDKGDTYRLGARHTFSPASTLIASFIHQDRDISAQLSSPVDFTLGIPGVNATITQPQNASGFEVQHLFRSERLRLRTGIGYVDVDRTENQDATLVIPLPSPPFPPGFTTSVPSQSSTPASSKHTNGYAYGTLVATTNLNFILGASYDSIDADKTNESGHELNPKFGVIWNATPGTTIRAAAFQVIKRTLITDQTLEPTEVAGFNQFFDDANFTKSKRYGAAVDQRFSRSVFAGLEFSKRDLSVPWTCGNPVCGTLGPREPVDWEEWLNRAYVFWTPHEWWALRAEYIFEKFDRGDSFAGGVGKLDSHRVPLGVRFSHPSGLSASFTETYWKQKGEFGDFATFQSGSDQFWVADAALSYRLPRRMGLVSVGATNLFDQDFRFFDVDVNNTTIMPKRMIFVRLTLALP
jgi:tetratricopeptide (TPR) repeat protein